MVTSIKNISFALLFAVLYSSCLSTKESIDLCGRKYDVYSYEEYMNEENIWAVFKTVCFHKSRYTIFTYLHSGRRDGINQNLVSTFFSKNDSSFYYTTNYDSLVLGERYSYSRNFKCLPNGVIEISGNENPNHIITKETARKSNLIITKATLKSYRQYKRKNRK